MIRYMNYEYMCQSFGHMHRISIGVFYITVGGGYGEEDCPRQYKNRRNRDEQ